MKLQVVVVMCVVMLVAADMASAAGGCDILQLMPCSAAAKDAVVKPTAQCCANVAKLGQGPAGAQCLCSLLSSSVAKAQGVVPQIALSIPKRCSIPVPKGSRCQGVPVPGS